MAVTFSGKVFTGNTASYGLSLLNTYTGTDLLSGNQQITLNGSISAVGSTVSFVTNGLLGVLPGSGTAAYEGYDFNGSTVIYYFSTGLVLPNVAATTFAVSSGPQSLLDLISPITELPAPDFPIIVTPPDPSTNNAPTGAVTIDGVAFEGRTLTASNNLADADGIGAVTYQWLADDQAIVGANGASFTLTAGQVGKAISVLASYTDQLGTFEGVKAPATAPVDSSPARAVNDTTGDILWRGADGEVTFWATDGTYVTGGGLIARVDPSYFKVAGFADATGDGNADILWRGASGEITLWQMNGTNVIGGGLIANVDPSYFKVSAFADASGDGKADILWRGAGGEVTLWQMDGTAVIGGGLINNVDTSYFKIVGFADASGDGKADILWRGAGGEVTLWQMDGTAVVGGGLINNVDTSYFKVVGFSDASGDGKADILWRGAGGEVTLWEMDGNTVIGGGVISNVDPVYYQVEGFADATGDGKADILWRGAGDEVVVWELNGAQLVSGSVLSQIDQNYWQVVG